jgi:hypothetical protein
MRKYLAILFAILLACAPAEKPVSKPEKPMAVLAVHSGDVLVNDAKAVAGQELKQGDIVRTGSGKASVVFFEGTVLRLNENTEIVVKEVERAARRVSLRQTVGQTWSRILKISGIKEYSIETPNTVATVRGTGFALKVEDGDTKIAVKKGKVHVASYVEEVMVAEAVVVENMEMEVTDEAPHEMELEAIAPDEWIEENAAADEEFVEEVVEEYMEEHPEMEEQEAEALIVDEFVPVETPEVLPEEVIEAPVPTGVETPQPSPTSEVLETPQPTPLTTPLADETVIDSMRDTKIDTLNK